MKAARKDISGSTNTPALENTLGFCFLARIVGRFLKLDMRGSKPWGGQCYISAAAAAIKSNQISKAPLKR